MPEQTRAITKGDNMALTIKEQMAQNSAAWHTSDAATKKKLEAANQVLGKSIGSSYTANTGTWQHAPEAVEPVATPVEDYYADYMKQQQASQSQARAEAERAAQLRTQSAVDTNNAYIPQVNAQTDKQLQQAYITAQQSKMNAPQAMAAMGYSGGAAESSLMGLDTNYQNNRNDLETSRNTSLDSIRQNANQIQQTGNAQLADLASQYYSQMASAQEQAQQNAQSQANWQANFDSNQQATERSNYTDTVGQYYGNYQAQKNLILGDGDPSNDWQADVIAAARQQKVAEQNASSSEQAQLDIDNARKDAQLNYNLGKPYFKPSSSGSGSGLSYSDALALYTGGDRSTAVLNALGLI